VGAMDGQELGRAVNQVAQGGDFVDDENGNGRGQDGHQEWLQEFHGGGCQVWRLSVWLGLGRPEPTRPALAIIPS